MPSTTSILSSLVLTLGCCHAVAADVPVTPPANAYHPGETTEQKAQRLKWFREARFGMFIHWGVYAVPAGTYQGQRISGLGEWIMRRAQIPVATYRDFAKDFTAKDYDPQAWAALAKQAGMRYVVITAKHHDGCALFDSAVSEWTIPKASPAKRDLIAPLEQAVRAQGLHFGLYYSQAQDWVNPGGGPSKRRWDAAQEGDFDHYLDTIAIPQIQEILSRFRPEILWWDTPHDMNPQRAARVLAALAPYPDLVMNDRLGGDVHGDCNTPEQYIPPRGFPGRDFEVCMTINETWGFKSYDDHWKSTRTILENLSDIASKGGNFLLNIGPTADGVIPDACVERLRAVGAWMAVNGGAIHGTQGSPFVKRLPWGRVTRTDNADGSQTLYLHVWNRPQDGVLSLPHGGQPNVQARLLATEGAVPVRQEGERLVLQLPAAATDPMIPVVRCDLPKPVVDKDDPLPKEDASGVIRLSVLELDPVGNIRGSLPVSDQGTGSFIGPWLDPEWKIECRVRCARAQAWQVSAEVATTAAVGIRLTVDKDKTPIKGTIPATGGLTSWQTVDLGRVSLRQGTALFSITAEGKDWSPINVRSVTLTPLP